MLQDVQSIQSLLILVVGSSLILGLRLWFTGCYLPTFAAADNPASHSDSFLTRTFTFFYLPAFNFGLFLYPSTLSFDWSMDSIPLIEHILDFRNIISLIFYSALIWYTYKHIIYLNSIIKRHCRQERAMKDASTSTLDINLSDEGVICKQFLSELQHHPASNLFSLSHHMLDKICSWLPNFNSKSVSKNYSVSFQHMTHDSYKVQCLCTTTLQSTSSKPKDIIKCNCVRRQDCIVVLMSVAMMVIPFIPASNLVAYVGFVVAERVLYIPSLGFCLLVGHGFVKLMERFGDRNFWKLLLMMFLILVLVTLGGRTILRNVDWTSEETLYRSGTLVNPAKGMYSTSLRISYIWNITYSFNIE
jgi:hypothetical protein